MKKILFFFSFVLIALINKAQVFAVDTLLYNGNVNKRINMVLLADGYAAAQQSQFISNATTISNYLLNTAPFSQYKSYFNVVAVKVISSQSGAKHPGTATDVSEPVFPVASVNNYLGSGFDYGGIHRLIVANNSSAVTSVLAANMPAYDMVMVIANSTEYGGSGGSYATVSIHSSSSEIAAHEFGHSFAGLADEYWAGTSYAAEKPNMTAQSSSSSVKWSPWVGLNSIGVFPYGSSAPQSQWFRPHQNCKMQFLGSAFCAVCKETIIEKIHSLTNPIDAYSPPNTATINAPATALMFKTTLLKPLPNTLKRTWKLNNSTVAYNLDSTSINNSAFVSGNNTVSVTVIDTNTLSKSATHPGLHTFSVVWNVNKSNTGINEINNIVAVTSFPNPANDKLNIQYSLQSPSAVGFNLINTEGKRVKTIRSEQKGLGEYEQQIDLSDLPEGIYFLQVLMDKRVILDKILVTR